MFTYCHPWLAIKVNVPRSVQRCADVIYIYERSTYRYVRLNALNVRHVHGPYFNAPKMCAPKLT